MNRGDAQVFMFVAGAFGVATTLFWMYVAWRAMRAHECLADAAERLTDRRDHST